MKISDITTFILDAKRDPPAVTAGRHLLVKVETDAGVTGWGEAFTAPDLIRAIIEAEYVGPRRSGLKALLLGEDPTDTEQLWQRMAQGTLLLGRDGVANHAMAAIDLALWDIKGKALGQPVHALLGGARRDRIDWYATRALTPDLDETVESARRLVARGCHAVQVRLAASQQHRDRGRGDCLGAARGHRARDPTLDRLRHELERRGSIGARPSVRTA